MGTNVARRRCFVPHQLTYMRAVTSEQDGPPSEFNERDMRNVDALCAMFDAASLPDERPHPSEWTRRLQRAIVEDVLRVLATGGRGTGRSIRREFGADMRWVREDCGSPGFRLSDICTEFGWDLGELRAELLRIARRAIDGHRRAVPTVSRPVRIQRQIA